MRTSATITESEVTAWEKFAQEHNILDEGEDGKANANLVIKYFQDTWPMDITAQTLIQAWPILEPYLKLKSAARIEAETAARQYFDVTRLSEWFASQIILVKDLNNEDAWANYAELCRELTVNNWPATEQNIVRAIKSIDYATTMNNHRYSTRKRVSLTYVGKPKIQGFTGKFIDSTKVQERRELEAESAQRHQGYQPGQLFEPSDVEQKRWKQQKAEEEQKRLEADNRLAAKQEISAWQRLCEELLSYGSHSSQAGMRSILDNGLRQQKEYRFIYQDMLRHKAQLERVGRVGGR